MKQTKRLLLLMVSLSAIEGRCSPHISINDSIPYIVPQDSLIMALPDTTSDTTFVRQFVVVNMESNVPIRDVLVYTDDGQETKTKWDGTFALRETFRRVNFAHPSFEKRYMFREEIDGDTIALIPSLNAINEVVVYGHRRNYSNGYSAQLSKADGWLLQPNSMRFDPLALVFWGLDEIWFKKIRHRKELKKQKKRMIIENY